MSTITRTRCESLRGWKASAVSALFHFMSFMPTRQNPDGTVDREVIEAGIAAAVAAQDR